MSSEEIFDVLVVGGSTAGLSAALVLGRALRRTLVLDAGQPCNRQAPHSHGLFTRDGETPQRLLETAREQLCPYPTVQVRPATVTHAAPAGPHFRLTTDQGETFVGRRLLLATGLHDQLPPIPGFAESWGRRVLHCPYCHGYEVHGQPLGVLINGETAFEYARLIRHWSPDVRLFTNGPATLPPVQQAALQAHGVPLIEAPLTALEPTDAGLRVHLATGEQVALAALFARVPFTLATELPQQLGCALTPQGFIQVDEFGHTTVPGVFAAGDNSSPMRQLAAASASGSKAAAFINHALIGEDFPQPPA